MAVAAVWGEGVSAEAQRTRHWLRPTNVAEGVEADQNASAGVDGAGRSVVIGSEFGSRDSFNHQSRDHTGACTWPAPDFQLAVHYNRPLRWTLWKAEVMVLRQIGRASCRERVYVLV